MSNLVGLSTQRVGRRTAASCTPHLAAGNDADRPTGCRNVQSRRAVDATRWPPKRGLGAHRTRRPGKRRPPYGGVGVSAGWATLHDSRRSVENEGPACSDNHLIRFFIENLSLFLNQPRPDHSRRPLRLSGIPMNERIPARVIETIDPGKPARPLQGAIHTRSFTGRYRTLRMLGSGVLFLLFFGTVWLTWNDRQAVLWDLADRQFHIFGATFLPQDFILLSALLIICAFGLFFITVAAGRVWCGYTCPQSVWTWVFMWAEKVTEGDRNQRIRLDAAPWSLNKLLKRTAKHGLWLGIGLVTGLTFVGYFTPIRGLVDDLLALRLLEPGVLWVAGFTAATYVNAGWLREKVCRDMCPYSRFQSVMFDRDTLLIAYDVARGEPRGARRKGSDPA